jgi:hypothetical protein
MDLERISLYSEKSKRNVVNADVDDEPENLDEILEYLALNGEDFSSNGDNSDSEEEEDSEETSYAQDGDDFSDFNVLNSNEIDDYKGVDYLDENEETSEEADSDDSNERGVRAVYIKNEPLDLVYDDEEDDGDNSNENGVVQSKIIDYIVPDYDGVELSKSKRSSQVVVEDPGFLIDSNGKIFVSIFSKRVSIFKKISINHG